MKWDIKAKLKISAKGEISPFQGGKNEALKIDELVDILLRNRGLVTANEQQIFLRPKLERVTADGVGIDKKQLTTAVKRIEKAIRDRQQIVVFGDYDVDGICGSAILWETLHHLGAQVLPYIPHRVEEGYGLSATGIRNILAPNQGSTLSVSSRLNLSNTKLIITVDNGIVANEAVKFAKEQGIDVIITDHHLPHEDGEHHKPEAFAIVHTTKLCGAGVAWVLAKEFLKDDDALRKLHITDHLVFAALATIADMVPLTGANRAVVKFGLTELKKTGRIGLKALFHEAGIEQRSIEPYQIGHVIAPRLNAAGRMESAMDSLRLLCTKDPRRAKELATALGEVNKLRQQEMTLSVEHAIQQIKNQSAKRSPNGGRTKIKRVLVVAHESYPQGVIGLVAGKLVEEFYRPSIVISIGETHSKASVRSVKGFNIIEFLRTKSEHFVNVGGHPMAAGFTIETSKITFLQQILEKAAEESVLEEHLTRTIAIDCELPLEVVSKQLYDALQLLGPFGIGNPEPVFCTTAIVQDIRIMGRDGKHLKLNVQCPMSNDKSSMESKTIEGVGFRMGEKAGELKVGDMIEIAFVIDENQWNGNRKLQLKLKDIHPVPLE